MSLYQYERDGEAQELLRVLREAENPEVRRRAAEILGRFEDHDERDDIVRGLVQAATGEESDAVVAAAIDGLDELGGDALEELIGKMANVDLDGDAADWMKAKAFVQALDAGVPELRMAAANALGELEEKEAVPHLINRFDDPDTRVRARAARACGQVADPRATDALESLLTDSNAEVRREAADALGNIGNRQALQALLSLYNDSNERVRRIAVSGFGKFESDQPVEYLVDALGDSSDAVQRAAVFSLIELLSNVPTEQSHQIRESIVDQLAATEDETVVAPLVEILEVGQQPAQKRNTAWLLGRVMDDESNRTAVDALIGALQADDQMTTQFASTSLAEIGGTYVEAQLLEIAMDEDGDSQTRAQAVFTLGKIGDSETAEKLEKLLDKTEDETVRQRTFSALSKLGGHQR